MLVDTFSGTPCGFCEEGQVFLFGATQWDPEKGLIFSVLCELVVRVPVLSPSLPNVLAESLGTRCFVNLVH